MFNPFGSWSRQTPPEDEHKAQESVEESQQESTVPEAETSREVEQEEERHLEREEQMATSQERQDLPQMQAPYETQADAQRSQFVGSHQQPHQVVAQQKPVAEYYNSVSDIASSGPNVTYLSDMPRSEIGYVNQAPVTSMAYSSPDSSQVLSSTSHMASPTGQGALQVAQYEGVSPSTTIRKLEANQESLVSKKAMIVQQVHQDMHLQSARGLSAEEVADRESQLRERERLGGIRADAYIEKELAKAEAKLQRDLSKLETRERAEKADALHQEAMVEKKAERKLAELQQKLSTKIAQAKEDRINAELRASERAKARRFEAEEAYREAVAAARDQAEHIRRGDFVPQEPSGLTKLAARLHL